jgi:hypothetical protein
VERQEKMREYDRRNKVRLFFWFRKQVFSQAIEPLTPGAAYLEQAASDADQLVAEAIASSTRPAYESDFFTAGAASLVWTRCRRRRAAIAATHSQGGHESPTSSEAVKVLCRLGLLLVPSNRQKVV